MSDTESRKFLRLIASTAHGSTLEIAPKKRFIDPTGMVISKANEIADMADRYQETKCEKLANEITSKTNSLLGLMIKVFRNHPKLNDVDTVIDHGYSVLKCRNFSKLNTKLIPASIMRELIHDYKIPLNIEKTPNFVLWTKTFQPACNL